MVNFFTVVFFQPIFNLLIWIYGIVPGADIGIAIILLTVIVKLVLWPLTTRALKSQLALSRLQPKMKQLQKDLANDKEKLGKAMMDLYSKEKVSPFSSCLPTLMQLPVFFALYKALSDGLKSTGYENLYPFIANPGQIAPNLFGIVDLANPNIVLAVLAAVTQYFQAKSMITRQQPKVKGAEDEEMAVLINRQMVYMMPVMTLVIGWTMPGGLILYWFVMNLLTILQQEIFYRRHASADEHVAA